MKKQKFKFSKKIKISVISTVFSEENSLVDLVNYLHKKLSNNLLEILFVYHPKSSKACINILKQLNKKFKKVKIIKELVVNKGGNGNAYRQGFKKFKGTHVLMIDSDGEMDVNTIPKMIKKMIYTNCDIVIGSRYYKGGKFVGYPLDKFILNFIFQYIFRILYSTKIKDLTCGYKLLKSHVIKKYKWKANFQDIGAETTFLPLKGGDKLEEVPTTWTMKKGEKHSLSLIGNIRYPILAIKTLFNI